MDRIMVAVAIGMALVFGTGIMVGVIAMVSMAIRPGGQAGVPRPGKLRRLLARGARRLNGVGLSPRATYPARARGRPAMSDRGR